MAQTGELVKKLQIKPGERLWLIDVPAAFAKVIASASGVEIAKDGKAFDGVIAFAETPAAVESIAAQVLPRMPRDGLFWICYRKGEAAKASGLSRDVGWTPLEQADWRPVRSVAIDAVWTGLRFKPVALVKSKTPDAWRTR